MARFTSLTLCTGTFCLVFFAYFLCTLPSILPGYLLSALLVCLGCCGCTCILFGVTAVIVVQSGGELDQGLQMPAWFPSALCRALLSLGRHYDILPAAPIAVPPEEAQPFVVTDGASSHTVPDIPDFPLFDEDLPSNPTVAPIAHGSEQNVNYDRLPGPPALVAADSAREDGSGPYSSARPSASRGSPAAPPARPDASDSSDDLSSSSGAADSSSSSDVAPCTGRAYGGESSRAKRGCPESKDAADNNDSSDDADDACHKKSTPNRPLPTAYPIYQSPAPDVTIPFDEEIVQSLRPPYRVHGWTLLGRIKHNVGVKNELILDYLRFYAQFVRQRCPERLRRRILGIVNDFDDLARDNEELIQHFYHNAFYFASGTPHPAVPAPPYYDDYIFEDSNGNVRNGENGR